ncbi:MAG: hypothetical protein AAGN66_24965 [Acidobacteriota bacterium]
MKVDILVIVEKDAAGRPALFVEPNRFSSGARVAFSNPASEKLTVEFPEKTPFVGSSFDIPLGTSITPDFVAGAQRGKYPFVARSVDHAGAVEGRLELDEDGEDHTELEFVQDRGALTGRAVVRISNLPAALGLETRPRNLSADLRLQRIVDGQGPVPLAEIAFPPGVPLQTFTLVARSQGPQRFRVTLDDGSGMPQQTGGVTQVDLIYEPENKESVDAGHGTSLGS